MNKFSHVSQCLGSKLTPQSQHYSRCSDLGIRSAATKFVLLSWQPSNCPKWHEALAGCSIWHLPRWLSFLSRVLEDFYVFAFPLSDFSPHFPVLQLPWCGKLSSHAPTVFSSSLGESETAEDQRISSSWCCIKQEGASGYGTDFWYAARKTISHFVFYSKHVEICSGLKSWATFAAKA